MSNNKQSSVAWLEIELEKLWVEKYLSPITIKPLIEQAKEMEVAGREMSYDEGYKGGYKRALDYMTDTIKNKIEVMENANNEFKKGTANTTHTTFLCTEFVSDASKGATLPRCIRCGKTQRIHPIITKNNEQQ